MVAIAMEKCAAEYLLVEIEDEIAERRGSMLNARTTKECSWNNWGVWGPCSESCGHGFMERVRTNKAGKSDKKDCIGLAKETKSCQIRNNNCEPLPEPTYSKSSDRDCDGQEIKFFHNCLNISTIIEFCNDQSSCNCFRDLDNNGDCTAFTGSSTHMRRNTTAWVKN